MTVPTPSWTPRRASSRAIAAARAADLVVVPCRPAVYDLETVAATVEVIRAVAPDTRFLCVLNGVPPRGPRQPQARELLRDMGVPVCAASLGLRAAVDYAAAGGASAQEYDPRGKAASEIAAVYDVVRRAVGLSTPRHDDLSTSRHDGSSTTRQDHSPACREADLSTSPQVGLSISRQDDLPTTGEDDFPTIREDDASTIREDHSPTSPQAGSSTPQKDRKSTGRVVRSSTRRRVDWSPDTGTDAGQAR